MAPTTDYPVAGAAMPILPTPQTGALQAPPDITDNQESSGADALAGVVPPMGSTIAQNTIAAGQTNHGDPRDWAENAVAGVQAALAGFGAGGKVPEGAGALYGVGAAMRQAQGNRQEQQKTKTEEQQRQQQIDIEQQRATSEQSNADRDYNLKLAENARQQVEAVASMQEHDQRMRAMNDEHDQRSYELMHEDVTFRQQQLDMEDSLKSAGAKPLQIMGKDAPGFGDLGQLEKFAAANKLGEDAHNNGYRTRPILGADGKYRLYELPDSGPEWHDVTGPDGKKTKIFTDPLGVANYAEKVANVRDANARATLDYAEAKKAVEDYKDQGTVKDARKKLDAAGGDVTKLAPGEKEALIGDAQKFYQLSFNAYQAAQADLRKDPDFGNVPLDQKTGNVDTSSKEYKDLADKYHVADADAELGSAYDRLRKLGYGYAPQGAGNEITVKQPNTVANPGAVPKPTQPGQKLDAKGAQAYLAAAGGDKAKAIQMATQDHWDVSQ